MIIQKASFVSLYCKIYTDSFSLDLINHYATGTQVYDFLMRSAGLCLDPSGSPRPDDCNLWYLGCCEKFGHMVLDDDVWEWSFGESSFDTVEAFVLKLYAKALTTEAQHTELMAKIEEGRRFDCMYQIGSYLDAKRRAVPWVKEPDHRSCREQMKSMVAGVKESLAQEGYEVLIP